VFVHGPGGTDGKPPVVKRTVDATTDEIISELQEALKAD
jgi:hypothetical protein